MASSQTTEALVIFIFTKRLIGIGTYGCRHCRLIGIVRRVEVAAVLREQRLPRRHQQDGCQGHRPF